MRLLNTTTLELTDSLVLVSKVTNRPEPYAILSHTWAKDEVSFQDLQRLDEEIKGRQGYQKILKCCEVALRDGIDWVWIDTCCIDKSSSAELSEAINSMYAWYENSEICYAYLSDVPASLRSARSNEGLDEETKKAFKAARWFTRGWCLQELIAPAKVEFYSCDWVEFGSKWSLCKEIESITGIRNGVFLQQRLSACCMAERLSWMTGRETTRVEDMSYCLLGILGINIPLLYGEGHKAFLRLQEELLRHSEDLSILMWTWRWREAHLAQQFIARGVLASDPRMFYRSGAATGKIAGAATSSGLKIRYEELVPHRTALGGLLAKAEGANGQALNVLQITNLGLRATLLVQKGAHKRSVLAWAGYLWEGKYVCIALSMNSSFQGYGRSDQSYLILVEPKEFIQFEKSEIYMFVNDPILTSQGSSAVLQSSLKQFSLILRPSKSTSMLLHRYAPSLSWQVWPDESSDSSPRPHAQEDSVGRVCFYRGVEVDYENRRAFEFKIRKYGSGKGTPDHAEYGYVLAVVGHAPKPWCSISKTTGREQLSTLIRASEYLWQEDDSVTLCDRASCTFSDGMAVTVRLRSSFPHEGLVDQESMTSVLCTLCIGITD